MTDPYRRNPCAATGAIAGILAGFVIALLEDMHGTPALPPGGFWSAVLLVTLASVLIVLFVLGIVMDYGIAPILVPAFVTCFLTVGLTIWIVEKIKLPWAAVPIGWTVGTLIGWILCYYFCRRSVLKGELAGG